MNALLSLKLHNRKSTINDSHYYMVAFLSLKFCRCLSFHCYHHNPNPSVAIYTLCISKHNPEICVAFQYHLCNCGIFFQLLRNMSEERQHHLFHHKKEEDNAYPETGSYGSDGYNASGGGYGASQTAYGSSDYQTDQPGYTAGGGYGASESTYVEQTTVDYGREEEYEKAKKEEKHHKHMEHGGELGSAAAGAFAMYEKHESKKDPEHAHRHKIEEEIAAAAAVGSGGFAFHEHHEKKEDKKEEEEAHGKKHHHLF